MKVLQLLDSTTCTGEAGVTKLGDSRYLAYVVLGTIDDRPVGVQCEGPSEYAAITFLIKRAQAWGELINLQLTEEMTPRLRAAEEEATQQLARQVGIDLSSAGLTKKSEPS